MNGYQATLYESEEQSKRAIKCKNCKNNKTCYYSREYIETGDYCVIKVI